MPEPEHNPKRWRHKPDDFREQFILQGWDTICWHYRAHWLTIKRWIDEEGRESLKAARAAHVRKHGVQRVHPEVVRHKRRPVS